MWPFRRRRRPEPAGTLRIGSHSESPDDYAVLTVSESRFPETFDALWASASDDERDSRHVRRWATLVPVRDPRLDRVADLRAEFGGLTGCYLRPPHLDRLAARIDEENVEALEVPALVEWGPAGASVRLLITAPPRRP